MYMNQNWTQICNCIRAKVCPLGKVHIKLCILENNSEMHDFFNAGFLLYLHIVADAYQNELTIGEIRTSTEQKCVDYFLNCSTMACL